MTTRGDDDFNLLQLENINNEYRRHCRIAWVRVKPMNVVMRRFAPNLPLMMNIPIPQAPSYTAPGPGYLSPSTIWMS